jgi:hypothetical protein
MLGKVGLASVAILGLVTKLPPGSTLGATKVGVKAASGASPNITPAHPAARRIA